jgi:probable HAF family extracellular repeat protein
LPVPAGYTSTAAGINNSGWVAGTISPPFSTSGFQYHAHAVVWANNLAIELDRPTDSSAAWDINDRGQVLGSLNGKAVLWDHRIPHQLNTLVQTQGSAVALNNLGEIIGTFAVDPDADGNSTTHAFLLRGAVLTDLGAISSQSFAHDINDAGQIVGTSDGRAVVWLNGKLVDLNSITAGLSDSLVLTDAVGINQKGQIVGDGYDSEKSQRFVFILTPNDQPSSGALFVAALEATPEPQTWVLLCIGCACAACAAARKRT